MTPPIFTYVPTIHGPRALTADERALTDTFVALYLAQTGKAPVGKHWKVPGVGRVLFTHDRLLPGAES